jgi:hypothetical protein
MNRIIVIVFILFICHTVRGQNLIPNSSFEDTLPHNGFCMTPIEVANHWFSPTNSTPDLFCYDSISINCTVSSMNNSNGYQLPRTGTAYAGFYTWLNETREYIAVKLDSILSEHCIYYIEFYISCAESFSQGTDNLGCAFTNDTSQLDTTVYYLPLTVAVESAPGIIMADTQNWTKISGFYEATGNEEYFIIGNFHDVAHTTVDTLNNSLNNGAYYYIDDVRIFPCDCTAAMIVNYELKYNEQILLFPNPTSDNLDICYYGLNQILVAEVYEQTGKLLFRQRLRRERQQTLYVAALSSGVYLLKITFEQGDYRYYKIIKQ